MKNLKNGLKPLHIACQKENEEQVRLLIEQGEDVNIKDDDGKTPLWIASCLDNDKIVECLLAANAKIDIADKLWRYTPIEWAINNQSYKVIKLFVYDKKEINMESQLCLFKAVCSQGDAYAVSHLVEKYPNMVKDKGLREATKLNYIEIVQYLLDRGANVNACDGHGNSPLLIATYQKHEVLVKLFLKRKDITIQMGAVQNACSKQSYGMVYAFLTKKPSILHFRDDDGQTLLHWCIEEEDDFFDDDLEFIAFDMD
mmetsp:Transcript_2263/g.3288  ORF Transcript_2263/g.3288 Transcript_2263/m.3288 type:complete len:256 (+) Transcript_2263:37-804(+)